MRWLVVAAMLLVATHASAAPSANQRFDRLVDEYYAGYAAAHPTSATDLGLHEHDTEVDDLSAAGVARETARLKTWRERFALVDERRLSRGRAVDLALVRSTIEAGLLELEKIQGWRHRADRYPSLASEAIYVLIKRSFAPPAERLRAVVAREEKIPALLAAGAKNLTRVPKVSVDIALDQMDGLRAFFRDDVPRAFPDRGKDQVLAARFERANQEVIRALDTYEAFLRKGIAPKATEAFALGEELFRAKLMAEEMVDEPLDALLERGEAELRRLQAEFRRVAAQIDPTRPAVEVLADVGKDHPPAERIIAETAARLDGLRRFLVEQRIVSLPSAVMPRVEETPPFMRATTFASMSTPGPFEKRAKEAFYNVTLPEPSWTPGRREEFLGSVFNRPLIDVVSIHETFPGHYVQFLWLPRVPSKVRLFEGAASNSEGWAHYAEQMMLDEGYGAGDPKLRLAQLQDALLRAARYVVGIRMHTRGMSFDEGVRFFEREGYQSHAVALMETRRGTGDPTYLVYTLGKLEILKLRDELKQRWGSGFSIGRFHDAFLAEGAAPIPLVRRLLLPSLPSLK